MRQTLSFITVLVFAMLLAGAPAGAQYRGHSAGIRIGNEVTADYKYTFSGLSGLNVTLGVINPFKKSYQFVNLSAAYNVFLSKSLKMRPYIGVGLSSGVQYGEKGSSQNSDASFFLSADIPIGIDYYSSEKPVVFCIQWVPKWQFCSEREFVPHSISVGVRFLIR